MKKYKVTYNWFGNSYTEDIYISDEYDFIDASKKAQESILRTFPESTDIIVEI